MEEQRNAPAAAVETRGLRHVYPDGTVALDGVDLLIAQGERVALLGPNGAGKSTLVLHLNGILRASEGEVLIAGEQVSDATVSRVRAAVGLVFQDPDDQLFMTTAYDDVAFGPLNMALPTEEVDRRVHAALDAVGLAESASRPAQHLSFGQRKRVAVATVLSMSPSIYVLDEPTSNLDPRSRRAMVEVLDSLDSTLLLATHDLAVARALCDRAIVMDGGKIETDLSMTVLLDDSELQRRLGLAATLPARGGPSGVSADTIGS